MKLRLLALSLLFTVISLISFNKNIKFHPNKAVAEPSEESGGDDGEDLDDDELIKDTEPKGQASGGEPAPQSPSAATAPTEPPPRPSDIGQSTAQLEETPPETPPAPPSPNKIHKEKAKSKSASKSKKKEKEKPKKKQFADGMHSIRSNCSIRSKPSTKGKKLGTKSSGSRTWVGKYDKKWGKIYYKSKLAFISMDCVK